MLFLSKRQHSDVKKAADWMQEWDGILSLVIIPHLVVVWVILFTKSFSPVSYQVDEIVKGRLLK